MLKYKHKGFTIVELLIVIVVIAILATIVIAAYNGVQNRARDAERRTDIRGLAQQLELFYQDNGYYPPYALGGVGINFAAWRTANMPNLKDALLTPPGVSSVTLVNNTTPTTTQYGYHNAGSCVGAQCPKYRLYWKSDVDGHTELYTGATG